MRIQTTVRDSLFRVYVSNAFVLKERKIDFFLMNCFRPDFCFCQIFVSSDFCFSVFVQISVFVRFLFYH